MATQRGILRQWQCARACWAGGSCKVCVGATLVDRTAASERPPHVILLIFLLLYALTFISVYCSRSYMLISYSITITGSPEVAFTIQNLDNNARVYKTALRLVGKGRREVL